MTTITTTSLGHFFDDSDYESGCSNPSYANEEDDVNRFAYLLTLKLIEAKVCQRYNSDSEYDDNDESVYSEDVFGCLSRVPSSASTQARLSLHTKASS